MFLAVLLKFAAIRVQNPDCRRPERTEKIEDEDEDENKHDLAKLTVCLRYPRVGTVV